MADMWKFDEEGWQADVAAILAEQRARGPLGNDKAASRERTMRSLEDHDDPEGDRLARYRGK
jgi:hypothetical protein